jgi:hypothetical protein
LTSAHAAARNPSGVRGPNQPGAKPAVLISPAAHAQNQCANLYAKVQADYSLYLAAAQSSVDFTNTYGIDAIASDPALMNTATSYHERFVALHARVIAEGDSMIAVGCTWPEFEGWPNRLRVAVPDL